MNNRAVSITSSDMEKQDPNLIPDEILEYRTLAKSDLVNKVVEARDELSKLKNTNINLSEVRETAGKKDHYAVANELYILRQTIKVVKSTQLKEAKEEQTNAKATKESSSATSQPKKKRQVSSNNRAK